MLRLFLLHMLVCLAPGDRPGNKYLIIITNILTSDHEERNYVEEVDEKILGVGRHDWGGEYGDIYSGNSALGQFQQTYHEECGHKYCEQRARFVLPNLARLKILPMNIPVDWKEGTTA
jgi:hypothetical protein